MSVKIRLTRGGSKSAPFYHIVLANSRSPRDGRFIEKLGSYNPMLNKDNPDRVKLNVERIKHWLSEGAQPTTRVKKFLGNAEIIEKTVFNNPQKAQLGKSALERLQKRKEKEEAAAAVAEA